ALPEAPTTPGGMICAAIGAVALAAASPLYLPYLDAMDDTPIRLAAPAAASGWALEPNPATQWRPHYSGAAASTLAVYRKGEHSVTVYLGYYRNQRQGAELVGSQNLIAGDSGWV